MSSKRQKQIEEIDKFLRLHNDRQRRAFKIADEAAIRLERTTKDDTGIIARALGRTLVAFDMKDEDEKVSSALAVEWTVDAYVAHHVEAWVPRLLRMHEELTERFEYNDGDNYVEARTHGGKKILIMDSQGRKMAAVFKVCKYTGTKLRVIRLARRQIRNAIGHVEKPSLKTLEREGWEFGYGDCRDAGHVLSLGELATLQVRADDPLFWGDSIVVLQHGVRCKTMGGVSGMTEYEKLRTIRASILVPIGGVLVYSKSKDRNPMDSVHEVVRDIKNRGIQVDPSKCDRDQLFELGFRPYQKDTTLLLLPLWVYPFMHPKASVTDIYGAVGNFEDAAQIVDVLQGCLPYGVRGFEIAETPKLPLDSDCVEV